MRDDEDDDKKDEGDGLPTQPFWMGTFADMVTLLFAFFVLLVAMSSVEVKKFQEALSYFNGGTGLMAFPSATPPVVSSPEDPRSRAQAHAQQFEELLTALHQDGLLDHVELNLTERGLHVVISDSVMFASGSAVLLPASEHLLVQIAAVLADDVASVLVEGHTDDIPIQTAQFPSNWELSAARAASVVRFLLQQPEALPSGAYAAVGYGEHRPLESNATPEGRAQNRRVEILFSREAPAATLPTTRNPAAP